MHIIFLGACNSGKSTLVNLLTGQNTSLVSPMAGTTTDPVRKPMELPGAGPCVLIDTAGFDDTTPLGAERVEATMRCLDGADVAVLLTGHNPEQEAHWRKILKDRNISTVELDGFDPSTPEATRARVLEAIIRAIPADYAPEPLLRNLVSPGDTVLLVMPQDSQAPKGRLIVPQSQTIRAIIDARAYPLCCTPADMPHALSRLTAPPALIITDSQAFAAVHAARPEGVPLTSFSMLLGAQKGDIDFYRRGARAIYSLTTPCRILIAEACTHAPATEDIGRVKIPALLRRKLGQDIQFDFVRGTDFPADLTPYSLIIHCGGCMFNRRYQLTRIARARAQAIPMTNYGTALAALNGILDSLV